MSSSSAPDPAKLEPAARMKLLVEMSHNITVDREVPVDRYFKSGRELLKSASAFESQGEIERAFILYLRYMTLFLEKLIHHPEYSKADKNEKKLVKEECNHVFDLAESLKKRIMQKYELEYEESKKDGGAKNGDDKLVTKRSIGPQGRSPTDCDVDEIDRKFDFSGTKPNDSYTTPTAFDPFNIEELKQSFSGSNT
uniref:STAM-binding protein n=1 Tax=Aceria tosichella TaxID=561515 RepID=A0A6G1S978_9ACAR